jgi:hypothetical protein
MHLQPSWRARARAALAVALQLPAGPAEAQVDPSRPFRSPLDAQLTPGNQLQLSASLFEGYDHTTWDRPFDTSGAPVIRGPYTAFNPEVGWRYAARRSSIGLTARSAFRYAPDFAELETLDRAISLGARTEFGRTALQVQQTATFRPYYEFTGLPDTTPFGELGALPDLRLSEYTLKRPMFINRTALTVSRQLGRYLWLRGSYQYRHSSLSFDDEPGGPKRLQSNHDASVSLVRQFGRNTRVQFGYGSRLLRSNDPRQAQIQLHQFDVGVLHGQRFALDRNTLLTVTGGPVIVESSDGSRVTVTGGATLHRVFSRAWSAALDTRRSIVYAEGFPDPLLSNTVSVSLQGGFGRRTTLSAYYALSHGDTSLGTVPSQLDTRSGAVRLSTRLHRTLAIYGEYVNFHQDIGRNLVAPASLSGIWDRQGLCVGLAVVVPIGSQRGVE